MTAPVVPGSGKDGSEAGDPIGRVRHQLLATADPRQCRSAILQGLVSRRYPLLGPTTLVTTQWFLPSLRVRSNPWLSNRLTVAL